VAMPLRSGLPDVGGVWSHKWGDVGVLGGVEISLLIVQPQKLTNNRRISKCDVTR